MTPHEWDKLVAELEKAKAQARLYAQDIQRLARERNEAMDLLTTLDETRAKLAVARATMADLRAKLAALQAKYNQLAKAVAHD